MVMRERTQREVLGLNLVHTRRRRGELHIYLRGGLLAYLHRDAVDLSQFEMLCAAELERRLNLHTKDKWVEEWAEVRHHQSTQWLPKGNWRKEVTGPFLRVYIKMNRFRDNISSRTILGILRQVGPVVLKKAQRKG